MVASTALYEQYRCPSGSYGCSQIAHASELDWAESQGMPRHIVRISVGLEEESTLIMKLDHALQEVETFENHSSMGDCSRFNLMT